jgi:hypothetical protein
MKLKMMALATVAAATFAAPAFAATEITVGYGGGGGTSAGMGAEVTVGGATTLQLNFAAVGFPHAMYGLPSFAPALKVYFNATQTPSVVPVVANLALRSALNASTITINIFRGSVLKFTATGAASTSSIVNGPRFNIAQADRSGNWTFQVLATSSAGAGAPVEGYAAVTAIPEPSTWMLMIMGFGLIASQLRRRYREGVATAA